MLRSVMMIPLSLTSANKLQNKDSVVQSLLIVTPPHRVTNNLCEVSSPSFAVCCRRQIYRRKYSHVSENVLMCGSKEDDRLLGCFTTKPHLVFH